MTVLLRSGTACSRIRSCSQRNEIKHSRWAAFLCFACVVYIQRLATDVLFYMAGVDGNFEFICSLGHAREERCQHKNTVHYPG